MNALTVAFQRLNEHIDNTVNAVQKPEELKAELMKLKKEELVERLMASMKVAAIKIEDIVKPILEDEDCKYLTYEQIATAVCKKVPGAKTSSKSIASYASKYPVEKGWAVVKRAKQADFITQLMKAAIEKGE